MIISLKKFATASLLLALALHAQAEVYIDASAYGIAPIELDVVDGLPVIDSHSFVYTAEKPIDEHGILRFLALAFIGRHPEIVQHKGAMFDVAELLLTEQAQSRFLDVVGMPPATRKDWKGANEFQTQRTFRSFVDEYGPVFTRIAPDSKFDLYVVEHMTLPPYDFDRGGYDIYPPEIVKPFDSYRLRHLDGRSLLTGMLSTALYINARNAIAVPGFLPMSAERAEALTNQIANQKNKRRIFYRAHVRVLDIVIPDGYQKSMDQWVPVGFRSGVMLTELVSLKLFTDLDFSYLVHDFGPPSPLEEQ